MNRYHSLLLFNYDNIGREDYAGAPSDAREEGAEVAPEKGTKMKGTPENPEPLYWALEFFKDEKAKQALHIYRMERHGQYQYLGLPEPNTIVVHRGDLGGFVNRLISEGFNAEHDFRYKAVFLAGQLSPEERSRLRRPGLHPQSKLSDPKELDLRLLDARERLKKARSQ